VGMGIRGFLLLVVVVMVIGVGIELGRTECVYGNGYIK